MRFNENVIVESALSYRFVCGFPREVDYQSTNPISLFLARTATQKTHNRHTLQIMLSIHTCMNQPRNQNRYRYSRNLRLSTIASSHLLASSRTSSGLINPSMPTFPSTSTTSPSSSSNAARRSAHSASDNPLSGCLGKLVFMSPGCSESSVVRF